MLKTAILGLVLALALTGTAFGQSDGGLKVFISVDMEGVTGVVNVDDARRSGKDYDYFRQTMTREANAAIEGALAAGATEIIVRDSHGSALNLLPEMLHRSAKLIRDWSDGPMSMMEGIDASYDAAIYVGYHAKAGTPNGVLDHTSSGDVMDISVNGVSMPETGYNALMAGYYECACRFCCGRQGGLRSGSSAAGHCRDRRREGRNRRCCFELAPGGRSRTDSGRRRKGLAEP